MESRLERIIIFLNQRDCMSNSGVYKNENGEVSILADKVTGDNIYKALIYFDEFYDKMNDSEHLPHMKSAL